MRQAGFLFSKKTDETTFFSFCYLIETKWGTCYFKHKNANILILASEKKIDEATFFPSPNKDR